jgi:hypothetical protein
MKNTHNSEANQDLEDELLPEYNFDYSRARPNRFATQATEKYITITLEPDVAKFFKTSEEVNKALRTLLSTPPKN